MKYEFIYYCLIYRAKYRTISEYTERHHIIPKCMGGNDDKINIVRLTPEEHYLAHQLLVRMHPDNPKLVYAAMLMTQSGDGTRTNNKLFGWIKRRMSDARKVPHSEARKKKNSESQLRRVATKDSTRAKMSASRTGLHRTEEQKRKSSETQRGRKKDPLHVERVQIGAIIVHYQKRQKRIDDILSQY